MIIRNRAVTMLICGVAASLALGVTTNGLAQETGVNAATQVVGLRMEKVSLYDGPNGKKVSDYDRKRFNGPWPITEVASNGSVQVTIDGKPYWLKAYTVKTDKRLHASAECGAVVAANEPKLAGTRGIGEGCRK